MASGYTIDDRYLFPNDPAVKAGTLVSSELLAKYVGIPLREEFHCFHMQDDGALGRVTIYGLYNVAVGGSFSADVFKGAVESSALRSIAKQNIEGAASYLVRHALRASNGDRFKARQIVRAAEVRDTRCFNDIARFYRTIARLNENDRGLELAADGKWVVTTLLPGSGARSLPRAVHLVNSTISQLQMVERGYRAAYAELDAQIGQTASRVPPERPASTAPRPKSEPPMPKTPATGQREAEKQPVAAPKIDTGEIQDATAQMRAALEAVRRSCLLKASIGQCG